MRNKGSLFLPVLEALGRGEKDFKIGGLWGGAKAFFIAQIALPHKVPFMVVTSSKGRAEELFRELLFFTGGGRPTLFPSWDILPYEPSDPRPDLVADRIGTLYRLSEGEPLLVVTSVEALLQKVLSPKGLNDWVLNLGQGEKISQEDLLERLLGRGYLFSGAVEEVGQASLRGGILDLFSPLSEHPVRLEFFGDTIESIRAFDTASQKSIALLPSVRILPGREVLTQSLFSAATLYDYLPPETIWIFEEPQQAEQKAKVFLEEVEDAYPFSSSHKRKMPEPRRLYLSWNDIIEARERLGHLDLESLVLSSAPGKRRFTFDTHSPRALGFGQKEPFEKTSERLDALRANKRIFLTVRTPHQRERVKRLLADQDLPWATETPPTSKEDYREDVDSGEGIHSPFPLYLTVADLSEGFSLPSEGLLYLTEEELFGKGQTRHRKKSSTPSAWGTTFEDLKVNDPVVHIHYGVGRYTGLKRLAISGNSSDFLVIEYHGGDKLYLPLDALSLVQRYVAPEGMVPRLDRLGGSRWKQTYNRIKGEVREMTQELLELYANREVVQAYSFSQEGSFSEEFAAAFEYEETPDQLRAIEEVLQNMESTRPMDRLVCGDVGYGKTEVAMRAAFKAMLDGKQVAVVVPTTLLAQQHVQTFTRRFARFPIKVDVMSRFRSAKEQKAILRALAQGDIDLLIGTHRLLQKDITFRDLGLLIIDEEHRFGVAHKERLKQLRKNVHVLTLTATPIPRTLQMSLGGLRDLSTIETPPADRLAIRTILAPFDRGIIREAILRELARGGQVFFVHNRVHNIEAIGRLLSELFPEAKIAIAHGQMRERQLEEVMLKFVDRKFDILLTTTIIESGLDIPTANTILINNADRFGLAELYQLRGRVGRSGEQAYAYLLVREGAILTDEARARLRAVQEFTELGSGFRIAARDLEIRGAGSLLGREQSGHVAAVGFDLYLQMIAEAARELKGEPPVRTIEPELVLPVSAFVPEEYVPEHHQRLSLYRRLASLPKAEDLHPIREELEDRYGVPPEPVDRLLEVMRVKLLCREKWVERLEVGGGRIRFQIDSSAQIEGQTVDRLLASYEGEIRFLSPYAFELQQKDGEWKGVLEKIEGCLKEL